MVCGLDRGPAAVLLNPARVHRGEGRGRVRSDLKNACVSTHLILPRVHIPTWGRNPGAVIAASNTRGRDPAAAILRPCSCA